MPETGDEPRPAACSRTARRAGAANRHAAAPKTVNVRIDLSGIGQRILAVNIPAGDYSNLYGGRSRKLLLHRTNRDHGICTIVIAIAAISTQRADGKPFPRRHSLILVVGTTRKKLLYQASGGGGSSWGIVATDRPAKVGEGPINVAQLEMRIDPRAEWEQIYRETWRIQREYFYDPKMHGNDWQAIYDKYRPLLAYVGTPRRPGVSDR